MTRPVFWLPSVVDGFVGAGDRIELTGPDGRHAVAVRRVREGEDVELVDGTGLRLWCRVVDSGAERLVGEVLSVAREPEPQPRLVVVQALAKGERSELAVEVLTEVGADVIVPWAAKRCVVQWRAPRAEKSASRWAATAREAAKQSRRARKPVVAQLASTSDVTRLLQCAALGVVLHEAATAPIAELEVPPQDDLVVVVGPEGGITDDEMAVFVAAGGLPVRLGPSVLRTSSAGLAACSVLLSRTPRWLST